MKIQNTIQNTSTTLTSETQQPNSLSNSCRLIQKQQDIYSKSPAAHFSLENLDIQAIISKAFLEQKKEVLQAPSSSNDPRMAALNALAARNFKTAPHSTLQIPLTGKGLGGMPGLSHAGRRMREINDELEQIDQNINRINTGIAEAQAQISTLNQLIQNNTDRNAVTQIRLVIARSQQLINQGPAQIARLEQRRDALRQEFQNL